MRTHPQQEKTEAPAIPSMPQSHGAPPAGKETRAKKLVRQLTPIELASVFANRFYNKMKSGRESLYQFFGADSSLACGYEGENVKVCVGQEDIERRFQEADYNVNFIDIISLDSLAITNGQFMIQVIGMIETVNGDHNKFSETFILAPQSGGGFYVLANVRRVSREAVQKLASPSAPVATKTEEASSTPNVRKAQADDITPKQEPTLPKAPANVPPPKPAGPVSDGERSATPAVMSDAAGKRSESRQPPKATASEVVKPKAAVPTPTPEVAKPSQAGESPAAVDASKKISKGADTAHPPKPAPAVAAAPATSAGPAKPSAPQTSPTSSDGATSPAPAPAPPKSWASAAANNNGASWDKKNISEVKGLSTKPSQPTRASPPPSAHPHPHPHPHSRRRSSDLLCCVYVKGVTPSNGVTKDDLKEAYSQFGEIIAIDVYKTNGAIVEFATPTAAGQAVNKRLTLRNDVSVIAEPKRERSNRPPAGPGPGRGGGGPYRPPQAGRGGVDRGNRRRGS